MFSSAARDLRDVVCRSRIRRISELASILAFEAHRASELPIGSSPTFERNSAAISSLRYPRKCSRAFGGIGQ
jgi:hypothetical protein